MEKHFAEIKENIVQRIIVIESSEFAHELLGGEWIDVSNKKADINDIYDPDLQIFIRPNNLIFDKNIFTVDLLKNPDRYYIVENKLLNFIPRNASTSLLTVIEKIYYSNIEKEKLYIRFPNKNMFINQPLHLRIPQTFDDGEKELIALIRHPIERFISGCYHINCDISNGIYVLKNKENPDIHIRPQYKFLSQKRETKYFKFPDQIDKLGNYLGLPTPIPRLNVSRLTKPVPTIDELNWLIEFYKKDFDIFNNL